MALTRKRPTTQGERDRRTAEGRAALESVLQAASDRGWICAGDLVTPAVRRTNAFKALPDERRFALSYTFDPETGCWPWVGSLKGSEGYGQIRFRRHNANAHRVSWEIHRGPVPSGLDLDHLCLNKRCVNPDHLEPVTGAENTRRYGETVTHCPEGHLKSRYPGGRKDCRQCHDAKDRVAKARKRVTNVLSKGSGRFRLPDADLEIMRERRAAGEKLKDLAAEFGLSARYAGALIRGARTRRFRHTGPPHSVLVLLTARSQGICEFKACAAAAEHTHHRRPRGMGSTRRPDSNLPPNLLRLCFEHHSWIESNRAAALVDGLLLLSTADPVEVPARTRHGRVYLGLDGLHHDATEVVSDALG